MCQQRGPRISSSQNRTDAYKLAYSAERRFRAGNQLEGASKERLAVPLAFNEGKVCEAILRYLESRERHVRTDVESPESAHHENPVELTWRLGGQLYALEHTGIEPFEDHMRLDAEAKRHFDPVKAALTGVIARDIIEIHVPAKAMLNRNKNEVALVQTALVNWVRSEAPVLQTRRYDDYIGDVTWKSIPAVPFPVRLFRFENLMSQEGWIQIVHSLDGDRDQERTERLRRACDKKFPKLAGWKLNHSARTILVFEENDIQLTNYAIVANTYLPIALSRKDRPDETYLVSTCVDPWNAWPLLIGNKTIYDLRVDDYVPRWEIRPQDLASATSR